MIYLWVFAFLFIFQYFVLWRFWKKDNWARYLVLFASALSLLSLLEIPNQFWWQILVAIPEALFSVYLLYLLNSSKFKDFFKHKILSQT